MIGIIVFKLQSNSLKKHNYHKIPVGYALTFLIIGSAFNIFFTAMDENLPLSFFIVVFMPIFLYSIVFEMIVFYRCWKALPPFYRTTTPAKAVGFLCIPFFNFYWGIKIFPELAKGYYDMDQLVGSRTLNDVSRAGSAYAILFLVSNIIVFIPLGSIWHTIIAALFTIPNIILFVAFYTSIAPYANRIIKNEIAEQAS